METFIIFFIIKAIIDIPLLIGFKLGCRTMRKYYQTEYIEFLKEKYNIEIPKEAQ